MCDPYNMTHMSELPIMHTIRPSRKFIAHDKGQFEFLFQSECTILYVVPQGKTINETFATLHNSFGQDAISHTRVV
jgi:hypothetical protein